MARRWLHYGKEFLILSAIVIAVLLTPSNNAHAATNQWVTATSTGSSGYVFNTVAAIGNYVYLGTDHGVYRSTDGGTSWSQMNAGLTGTKNITSIAIGWIYNSSTNAYATTSLSFVFVGTSDAGVFASTIGGIASTTWTATSTGLSDLHILDLKIDQFQVMQGSFTDLYAATPSGVYISTTTGSSWQLDDAGLSGTPTKLVTDYGNAKIYALTNGNKIYASNLYSSGPPHNYESWSQIFDANGTTTNDISILNAAGSIGWLSTSKGIYKSDNHGSNWASTNIGLPGTPVNNVASDYSDQNIAYAAVPGSVATTSGVYRTTNEAIANANPQIPEWLPINIGLSDFNIKEVKTDPSNSMVVYAVSANGLYQLTYANTPIENIENVDLTPPSTVTNLAASPNGDTAFTLTWTTPGNDGTYGTSTSYDIRYSSSSPITDLNWSSATPVVPQPTPWGSGYNETYPVLNLLADTTYYFALKSGDGPYGGPVVNQSALSNVASTIDDTKPVITSFTIPSSYGSLILPITTFTATDDRAVMGYLVNQTAGTPSSSDPNWTSTATTSYTFSSAGAKTLYAWAKDAAGNISISSSSATTVSVDATRPNVTAFSIPASYTTSIHSPDVPITTFTATDNAQVTGYLLTETSTNPSVNNPNWSSSLPTTYSFSSSGTYTLYAWAKDASGNISLSSSNTHASIIVTIDNEAPTITTFNIPTTSSSFTVPVTLTATDNISVAGYIVCESDFCPDFNIGDNGNFTSLPATYTFASDGTHTLYAYAEDVAGNTSSASVSVTIDTSAPFPPTNLSATAASASQINLSWTVADDNMGVAGYNVFRGGTAIATTTSTSYSDTGLSASTAYTYTIRAYDTVGNYSGQSSSASATTQSGGGGGGGGSPGGGGGGTSPYYILTVTKQGTGLGTSTSSPSGITCGSTCSYSFYAGSTVILYALPQTGSHLTSWTGCTSIATSSCTVMLSASKTIIVNFGLGSATTTITNTAPVSLSNCPTGLICTPISGGGLSTTTPLITKLLSIGSIDPQVILLQELLNGNGYPVTTSGAGSLGHEIATFGPATQKALQKFQCAKLSICSGSPTTTGYGSTDQQTRNALNALPNRPTVTTATSPCPAGQVCTPIATPQPSITYSPTFTLPSTSSGPSAFTRSLTLGSTGSDVTLLQETLNSLGYIIATTGNGSPGHESTYFGLATQTALQRYQCTKGIACSGDPGYGMMGPRTIASLEGKTIPVTITTPATTTIIPTKTTITVPTHIPIPTLTPVKVPTPTPSATTSIKVPPPVSTPTPPPLVQPRTPPLPAPFPTTPPVSNFSIPQSTNVSSVSGLPLFTAPLTTGSTGKEVKNLQIFLNDLGFSVNETQTYDTATAAAVKRFQKAYSSQIASYGGGSTNGVFDGPTMEAANGVIGG